MTTILAIFIIALLLSLVLTPVLGRLGLRFGAVDEPDELKVHTRSIARCGGMGIFLSFLLTLAVSSFFSEPLCPICWSWIVKPHYVSLVP